MYFAAKWTKWMISVLLASIYILWHCGKALPIIKHGFAIISWLISQHVSSGYDARYIFVEHERSVKKFSLSLLWLQQKTFNDYYGNHSPTITTIVPSTIAETDLISTIGNRWSLGQYQQWTAIGMIKLPEWSSLNFNTLRRHSTWASLKRYLIPERYHLKLTCLLFLLFFDKILKIPRELKTEAQVHPDHLTP